MKQPAQNNFCVEDFEMGARVARVQVLGWARNPAPPSVVVYMKLN